MAGKTMYALAYARVSTLQQAAIDLSIPAQLKAIRDYAEQNNITIIKEYVDEGLSAYHDNQRIQFEQMIEHAVSDPNISRILVHDSSRFSRDKYQSNAVKSKLRKFGVMVIPVASPYDPNTIDGLWRESIDDALSMTSSMQTAFHVMKGMKENAMKRDSQTGYCYKNGGVAPYGYKKVYVNVGKDNRGKDIIKSLWELDPVTSPIIRMVIVDWRINEGLSYDSIRDRLNNQGIMNSKGILWSTSTLVYMLKEDRILEYAGVYFWNKTPRRNPTKRYNDRSEWVEVPNAHPAIITMEEAQEALRISKSRQPRTPAARSYNSRWILTGNNIEGKAFFTCKCCGGNIVGAQISRPRGLGKYVCSSNHNKGKLACANNTRIQQSLLEDRLLDMIEDRFGNVDAIEEMTKEINGRLESAGAVYSNSLLELQKQLDQVKQQIDSTFDAYANGMDKDLCNERLNALKEQRIELEQKYQQAKMNQPQQMKLSPDKILEVVSNLKELYRSGTNEQKRTLIRTFIKRLVFDPETQKIDVVFFAKGLQETIKRGNSYSYPRIISGGAGDRGRTGTFLRNAGF